MSAEVRLVRLDGAERLAAVQAYEEWCSALGCAAPQASRYRAFEELLRHGFHGEPRPVEQGGLRSPGSKWFPKLRALRDAIATFESRGGDFFDALLPAALRSACDKMVPSSLPTAGRVSVPRRHATSYLCNALLLNAPRGSPLDFLGGGADPLFASTAKIAPHKISCLLAYLQVTTCARGRLALAAAPPAVALERNSARSNAAGEGGEGGGGGGGGGERGSGSSGGGGGGGGGERGSGSSGGGGGEGGSGNSGGGGGERSSCSGDGEGLPLSEVVVELVATEDAFPVVGAAAASSAAASEGDGSGGGGNGDGGGGSGGGSGSGSGDDGGGGGSGPASISSLLVCSSSSYGGGPVAGNSASEEEVALLTHPEARSDLCVAPALVAASSPDAVNTPRREQALLGLLPPEAQRISCISN